MCFNICNIYLYEIEHVKVNVEYIYISSTIKDVELI